MSEVSEREYNPKEARRAFAAGAVGTAVEYYDFFVYGTAAALVLNGLFFPSFDPVVGTLAAFATFAVGFIVRPIGSVIFGHIGDRFGRKKSLVLSLLLMGVATLVIGLLPNYDDVGVLAPILLVTLRCIQGIALGGEWGGATVLASEYARPHNRGFVGSLVQLGSPIGLLLASGVFALVALLPDEALVSWGWRLPFLLSGVMVAIGLYIRLNLLESPEFIRARAAGEMSSKVPAIDVFRYSWRELITAICIRFAPDIGFYVFGTFIVSYAVATVGFERESILIGVSVAAGIEICTIPLFGKLSDKFGRRPLYLIGAVWWAIIAFPAFWLVNTGSTALAWIAIIITLAIGHAMLWSMAASLNSELFPTRYRLTGANFGLNISAIVAGGPAALIASSLVIWAGGGSWAVSLYVVLAAAVSFVAMLLAPETSKRRLSEDYTTGSLQAIKRQSENAQ
ncbi:MFS transporter [Paramicrobacterium chengjingii]|uniref:MFS transporter n=1 Tax=Paramicrobacterium chengjingii TaxID=2769067 RepID=UPI00141E7487|nr:MFS transporter [Microbacterium chengjingii]